MCFFNSCCRYNGNEIPSFRSAAATTTRQNVNEQELVFILYELPHTKLKTVYIFF